MIYDELRNYLGKVAAPETVEYFDAGVEILEKYNVPNYLEVFETVVGESSQRSDADVLDMLQVNLKVMLTYVLTMQGVALNDDITPSQLNTLTDALFTLTTYEDKDAIRDILQGESDGIEMLCELLALVTELSVDELMAMVESVSPNFADSLTNTLEGQQEQYEKTAEEVGLQIKAFISLKKYLKGAAIFADRYFQQLGSIGLDLATYVQLYQTEQTDLATLAPSAVAMDLMGLACLSRDGNATPAIAVRGLLSTLFSDINTSTKVDIEVFGLSMKWEAFNAQA